MTIAVIGATGNLGRALMNMPNTISCPIRFEDADNFEQWFEENKDVDTVWYVARACRKTGVRRNIDTFMLEQNAMLKLLETRVKNCRIVYASTKVVFGITGNEITPLSAATTAESFTDNTIGTVNFPAWKVNNKIDTSTLGNEHLIYAMTKLACEQYIRLKCSNYKIIRIWDIV